MRSERAHKEQKKSKGDELEARLAAFGGRVVAVTEELPSSKAGRHLHDQLLRSGTAPGAHYAEARSAQSDNDFTHKVGLAAKEAREALYWLRIVRHARMVKGDLSELISEADEVVAILFSSLQTSRE